MGARPKVRASDKRRLVAEAGGKCANPGCPNVLVELHHIREWHVHKAHDPADMIALCPACHDAVDRGDLCITDEIAYEWKSIIREVVSRGHLYVEPSDSPPKLLLGSIAAQGESGLVVFSENAQSQLSFRVAGLDIMHLSATVSTVDGRSLVRVTDSHYEVMPGSAAHLVQRPGHFRVSHSLDGSVMPMWALLQIRRFEPDFARSRSLPMLDMQVLAPNVVRVQGIWLSNSRGMVITKRALSFLDRGRPNPLSLRGVGLDSVLLYAGPADKALFGYAEQRGGS